MKDIFRVRRMWRPPAELKRRYDVVIVGGGSHGLATAYYLAKNHGVRNVAVLEQSYIGSGAAGRNTTIIRSNYRTPGGRRLLQAQRRAVRGALGRPRLQPDVLAARAPDARALGLARSRVMRERAEVNKLLGIDSRGRLARRDRAALPAAQPRPAPDLADPRRALPPAGRDHPPRRGRVGVRPRRRPRRGRDPPGHAGDRDRHLRRPRDGASRPTAGASRPTS